jgi:hypothetical protein
MGAYRAELPSRTHLGTRCRCLPCLDLAREIRRRRRTLRPLKRDEGVRHLALRMRPIYSEEGFELPAGQRLHFIGVALVDEGVKETFGKPTRYATTPRGQSRSVRGAPRR